MKICFARPNTIIANEETEWKQIKTQAKVLAKSTSLRIYIFHAVNLHMCTCLSNQLAFESKRVVFHKQN